VVFTVPHELNVLALNNPRAFYELLFRASAASALELAADQRHLGAEIGMISILHTWGQNLLLHPHVHCVIPAGGLSVESRSLGSSAPSIFPASEGVEPCVSRQVCRRPQTPVPPSEAKLFRPRLAGSAETVRQAIAQFVPARLGCLCQAFGGPSQVLRYLGRYTHRVAISNHRIVSFVGERVTFRYKDYAHGGKHRVMTLTAIEFLRRFFLNVLPKGFVRIRHFGFLANRWRKARLAICREVLGCAASAYAAGATPTQEPSSWKCPECGAPMIVVQKFTAAELSLPRTFFDSS